MIIRKSPGSRHREHIAVDKIEIPAFLSGDQVEVLKLTDIIRRHPAVLTCCGVSGHPARVITPKQTVHVELEEILLLLIGIEKRPGEGLLPSDNPGIKRILHEFKRLLFNIGEARFLEIRQHMRRDSEDAGDLVDLELPCFQKLSLFGRYGDGSIFHPFLQYSHLAGVL